MSTSPEQAVFDCNVYLQALANANGAAGRCLDAAFAGAFRLLIDRALMTELFDVVERPGVRRKLRIVPARLEKLRTFLIDEAVLFEDVPTIFTYARDPDDEHYVNLALATGAMLVVSRDQDLLDLMSDGNADGVMLRNAHPAFQVITPPQLLRLLEDR